MTALVTLDERSGEEPGTIVGSDDEGIRVATGTEDVRLRRFAPRRWLHPDGGGIRRESGADTWCTAGHAVGRGGRDPDLDSRACRATRTLLGQAPGDVAPLDLPYAPVEALSRRASPRRRAATSRFKARWRVADGRRRVRGRTIRFAAVTLAWLARLTDAPSFDVDFADAALRRLTSAVGRWFADSVPLRVEAIRDRPLSAQIDALAGDLRAATERRRSARSRGASAVVEGDADACREVRVGRSGSNSSIDWRRRLPTARRLRNHARNGAAGRGPLRSDRARRRVRVDHDPEVLADEVIRRLQAQLLALPPTA